jgi:hypothetical protein
MGQTSLDIHPLCNLLGCFLVGMGMHYPQFSSIVANPLKMHSRKCTKVPLDAFPFKFLFILQSPLNFHNHVASSNFSQRKLPRFSSIDVIPQKQGPVFYHPYKCYLGMAKNP